MSLAKKLKTTTSGKYPMRVEDSRVDARWDVSDKFCICVINSRFMLWHGEMQQVNCLLCGDPNYVSPQTLIEYKDLGKFIAYCNMAILKL